MVFFATIGLLIMAVGIPIYNGRGHPHCRPVRLRAVCRTKSRHTGYLRWRWGSGLFSAMVGAMLYARAGGTSVSEWMMLAWVCGSAVTGQVAFL